MINSRPSNHLPDPLRRARAFALLVGAAALTCGLAWSEGLSIALIPPLDRPDVAASVGAFARTFGLQVDELTPEQLVNPAVFSPKRYPAAIYTGLERYVYEVFQPGDGAEALLRYLGEGGTLIVSGVCWPFYRPFKWINGSLQRYDGTVPEFRGPKDAWLEKAMTQLNQSATGSLNRFLGLNISGEGTTQFESPDESIEFRVSEAGRKLFPRCPSASPFHTPEICGSVRRRGIISARALSSQQWLRPSAHRAETMEPASASSTTRAVPWLADVWCTCGAR